MILRHALLTRCIVGCLLGGAALAPALADLPPTLRVVYTFVRDGADGRRLAIVETARGGQRMVAEGDTLGACLVKRIRPAGIDLDCHGRARSLGIEGRSRSA